MNPILLKPTGERTSQVVVMGRPWRALDAADYHDAKPALLDLVLDQLADLRARFDVVICEGAGSPAEINLLDRDIVNLRVAHEAGLPAIVVGDIDRGGVFAALYGTVALLPDDLRALVRGFVINKFRGDPALLGRRPGRAGAPQRGADARRAAAGWTGSASTPRTRWPWAPAGPGRRRRPLPVRQAAARRGRHPLPAHLQLHRPRPAGHRARGASCAWSTAARPSAGPTWSSCRAPRPPSPTWPGCARRAWPRPSDDSPTDRGGRTTVLGICGGYQMLGHPHRRRRRVRAGPRSSPGSACCRSRRCSSPTR